MGNSDLCPVVVVIQLMWIDLVKLAMVVRVSFTKVAMDPGSGGV